jgi:hypothetical protein
MHKYGFWEVVVMLRRAVLIALMVQLKNSSALYSAVTFANVLFLCSHIFVQPFRDSLANKEETITILVLTLITTFLAGAPLPLPKEYAIPLSSICIATAVGMFLAVMINKIKNRKPATQTKVGVATEEDPMTLKGNFVSSINIAPSPAQTNFPNRDAIEKEFSKTNAPPNAKSIEMSDIKNSARGSGHNSNDSHGGHSPMTALTDVLRQSATPSNNNNNDLMSNARKNSHSSTSPTSSSPLVVRPSGSGRDDEDDDYAQVKSTKVYLPNRDHSSDHKK